MKRIKLFKLFGFEVRLHPSWFIIAVLVAWSLAMGLFPFYYKGLASWVYWTMGIAGALLLFASVIVHELLHSLVARHFGMPMHGITLFIFGGIAEMTDEPPSATAEFSMAVAGPLTSVALGFIFLWLYSFGLSAGWSVPFTGVLSYMRWINFVLAAFNFLPAFPLDGGRALRAILWGRSKKIVWSTKVASRFGSAFGFVIIAVGVFYFLMGSLIGGAWWVLIGLFLNKASKMSYQNIIMREILKNEKVRDFMDPQPVTVSPDITVREFVKNFVYRYRYSNFPVTNSMSLKGCLNIEMLRDLPREEWDKHTVKEYVKQCSSDSVISADESAVKLMSYLQTGEKKLIMVVEGDKLAGTIDTQHLSEQFALKLRLEGGRLKEGRE